MDKKNKITGVFIIASALIWGAVIIGCSYGLNGTECYDKIRYILAGGVLAHIFLVWGPISILSRKTKQ